MAKAKQLPSGSWRVLVYSHTEAGKRKYASYTAPSKKEAEYLAALGEMKQRSSVQAGLTVNEAIERYIMAKNAVLSPATVMGYRSMQRNLFPALLTMRASELTPETVQREVNDYARGRSPKSVRNAFALLSSACNLVMGIKLTATLPQQKATDVTIPTHEQIKALLHAAQGTPMYTAILMLSSLGLRRSELCALTWHDIDLTKRTIRINKAMVPDEDFVWVIKQPKTRSSNRTLRDIPAYIIEHLRTLPRGERVIPISPSLISQRFTALCASEGIHCRLHDLRHYNASIMLALGVPDLYAMHRLGHSTTHMLKSVYQHLMDDKEQEVGTAINAKLDELYR